jgi:hypothetical protein
LAAKSNSWLVPVPSISATYVTAGTVRARPAAIAAPSDTPNTSTRLSSTQGNASAWRSASRNAASQLS